jgi:hypothetical protein
MRRTADSFAANRGPRKQIVAMTHSPLAGIACWTTTCIARCAPMRSQPDDHQPLPWKCADLVAIRAGCPPTVAFRPGKPLMLGLGAPEPNPHQETNTPFGPRLCTGQSAVASQVEGCAVVRYMNWSVETVTCGGHLIRFHAAGYLNREPAGHCGPHLPVGRMRTCRPSHRQSRNTSRARDSTPLHFAFYTGRQWQMPLSLRGDSFRGLGE